MANSWNASQRGGKLNATLFVPTIIGTAQPTRMLLREFRPYLGKKSSPKVFADFACGSTTGKMESA